MSYGYQRLLQSQRIMGLTVAAMWVMDAAMVLVLVTQSARLADMGDMADVDTAGVRLYWLSSCSSC